MSETTGGVLLMFHEEGTEEAVGDNVEGRTAYVPRRGDLVTIATDRGVSWEVVQVCWSWPHPRSIYGREGRGPTVEVKVRAAEGLWHA